MLPNSFRIVGRPYDYIDLRELFELHQLPGRFRDWISRKVIPLLGTAAIQYSRKDAHGNSRDYCVAKPNAIALLATFDQIEVIKVEETSRSITIEIPMAGFSVNKMYEPDPRGTAKKSLRKTAEYNQWIKEAKEFVSKKPRWLKAPRLVEYEFSMPSGSDADNLVKSFQDLIFQHAWKGSDHLVRNFHVTATIGPRNGYWCRATIHQ